jgi:hypothetical protein
VVAEVALVEKLAVPPKSRFKTLNGWLKIVGVAMTWLVTARHNTVANKNFEIRGFN